MTVKVVIGIIKFWFYTIYNSINIQSGKKIPIFVIINYQPLNIGFYSIFTSV